jgi:hypothetical protein
MKIEILDLMTNEDIEVPCNIKELDISEIIYKYMEGVIYE